RATADAFKLSRALEVMEETVPTQNVFQDLAQPGYGPLAVADFINQAPICLAGPDLVGLVEGCFGGTDAQLRREDHERISCRPENGFGVIARRRDFLLAPLERVDVRQH